MNRNPLGKAALQKIVDNANKLRLAKIAYKKRKKSQYDKEYYETRRPASVAE